MYPGIREGWQEPEIVATVDGTWWYLCSRVPFSLQSGSVHPDIGHKMPGVSILH